MYIRIKGCMEIVVGTLKAGIFEKGSLFYGTIRVEVKLTGITDNSSKGLAQVPVTIYIQRKEFMLEVVWIWKISRYKQRLVCWLVGYCIQVFGLDWYWAEWNGRKLEE